MMFLESWLVYVPPNPNRTGAWDREQPDRRDVSFVAEDGTRLHGWYYPHEQPQHAVVYFHGNAEDVAQNGGAMAHLRDALQASVLVFDYRGYGKSEGSPYESGLILDGLAAQRWLADELGVGTEDVVLIGRSLGGGVAVAVAEQQGAKALVLQNTFANMAEVAAGKFPWLPVRLIMRNQYPSSRRIKAYDGPLLQMHGTDDEVVPIAQGRKLFEAAPTEQKKFLQNEGLTHNAPLPKRCTDEMIRFLGEIR